MPARLLIVDDELDIREFAVRFFKKRNIEVFSAANGEEAIRKVIEQRPNIILLDFNMPGIDGIETLKRIRQLDQNINIIMVTGKKPEENNTMAIAKAIGAIEYLHKPLEIEKLEKIVMKLAKKIAARSEDSKSGNK